MTNSAGWHEVSAGRIVAAGERRAWPASVPTAASLADEIEAAVARVRDHRIETPVRVLEVGGVRCAAKLEALQRTGSFKIRGAANQMLSLGPSERASGVITASSGNHGVAVAQLAAELGLRAVVCVPHDADPVKLGAIRAARAEVLDDADDYDSSERQAQELSARFGLRFIHPFDDLRTIAGHATLAVELAEQVPEAAAVLIPLSGGGLAAGVAASFRTAGLRMRLIGVSPSSAPVMYRSLLAGAPVHVDERPTIAGALRGGLGDDNRHSFALVHGLLDEVWLISEEEIAAAMIWGAEALGTAIEGAGAVALAALARPAAVSAAGAGPAVAVVSGGNVDADTVQRARRIVARMPQPEPVPETHSLHP